MLPRVLTALALVSGCLPWYDGEAYRDNEVDDATLLLVTTSELAPHWTDFVEWKRARGIPTRVVEVEDLDATEEGADRAERVRARIRRGYDEEGTRAVLLGADSPDLPHHLVETWADLPTSGLDVPRSFAAEIYFANLDDDVPWGEPGKGANLLSHVALGRVPASTPEQIYTWTNKLLGYERNPMPDYQDSALLMGEWAGELGMAEFYSSGALEASVLPLFPDDFEVHRLYEDWERWPDSLPNTRDNQLAEFEAGRNLALNFGHGSPYYMSNLRLEDIWALENHRRPMIFTTVECSGCAFHDEEPEKVACEAFLFAEGGGVAYLGNTTVGIGFPSLMLFYMHFYEHLFDGRWIGMGERVAESQAAFTTVDHLGEDGHVDRWSVLAMVLMGDPTMVPWTGPPTPPEIEEEWRQGEGGPHACYRVTVGGDPVMDATVALTDQATFLLAGETDEAGEACFVPPRDAGAFTATVTGPGLIPAELVSDR